MTKKHPMLEVVQSCPDYQYTTNPTERAGGERYVFTNRTCLSLAEAHAYALAYEERQPA